jgi:hypothetical protein
MEKENRYSPELKEQAVHVRNPDDGRLDSQTQNDRRFFHYDQANSVGCRIS